MPRTLRKSYGGERFLISEVHLYMNERGTPVRCPYERGTPLPGGVFSYERGAPVPGVQLCAGIDF